MPPGSPLPRRTPKHTSRGGRALALARRSVPARLLELARRCAARLVEVEFVDRSIAIASLTFTALVPMLVVVSAYVPGVDRDSFADSLTQRFRLSGASAEAVHEVFAQPSATRQAVSVLSVLLLIASALSFTRGLQRVYERAWRLPSRGIRGTRAGLVWLVGVAAWVSFYGGIRTWLIEETGFVASLVVALGGSAVLWLWSPFVLLGRRVPWRHLLPGAVLTATGNTLLSAASVIYMPDAIAQSSERYGPIGIAIALVSWLVAAGFVLVTCATVGAVLGEERYGPSDADSPGRSTSTSD